MEFIKTKNETMHQILPESLIAKLFPNELPLAEDWGKKYPPRELPEEAMVTRLGPSPTGLMHLGGVYASLISERFAHQTNGVFYLRIEDTDEARSRPETTEVIVRSLDFFNIPVDEGMTISGEEKGNYGPYIQSARAKLYQTFVKQLVERGKAYPCFCTSEETNALGEQQMKEGIRPGYYGKWAKWRDASPEEVETELSKGTPYVIRLRSNGNFENKIKVHDLLKGDLELSENDIDKKIFVPATGLPRYHLAHVIDDHFMGTTHVLRGDEWLSSVPLHLELFEALGWKPPQYGHLAPIQKMEDDSKKRKLSKRKDPEANAMLYQEEGFPPEAVVEYLLNLANSDFEDWRKENPGKDNREFHLTFERLARSNGPLLDFVKLNDVSKEIISRMSASEIYDRGLAWAKQYNQKLAEEMERNPDYTKDALNIEREGAPRPRKDIGTWSDLYVETGYFFDAIFQEKEPISDEIFGVAKDDCKSIINSFLETYEENDTKDEWFEKVKDIGRKLGYADGAKAYKLEPEKYKGQVGDVAKIFRVLLTGKTNTPDLYSLMKVMGKERVTQRLKMV
ncbi:MAG: glutamate--tRNA ligase family protein [Candidatus Parcubacteria bacterium]|nr:glutamate--tRNA ligase family protein [Candidatus Parcubacteria bacterium]